MTAARKHTMTLHAVRFTWLWYPQ